MNLLSKMIHQTFYSRWINEKGRRETWNESVDRYKDFFNEYCPESLKEQYNEAIEGFRKLEVVPSMRAFWSAGDSLKKNHIACYNCAFTLVDHPRIFSEILYILMHGCGVGFSVESEAIKKLPEVPKLRESETENIIVKDSREGWAMAVNKFIKYLYSGIIPTYDLSNIRAKGTRLKTSGGRASGGEVLGEFFESCKIIFKKASLENRKLTPIECHDLICFIAKCVVAGGTRRSACISLSDLGDTEMRSAKEGAFWNTFPQRTNANNTAIYNHKPSSEQFISEMLSLIKSRSGERGIFNRGDLKTNIPTRRQLDPSFGLNPCGEVLLKGSGQFCNLSEVIVRKGDSLKSLKDKIRKAVLFGCLQSMLTNFNFISKSWKKNCEEERLLGVSMTGIMDHEILNNKSEKSEKWFEEIKDEAVLYSIECSKLLGINIPAQVTVIKPSGTTSLLVDSSAGIHGRWSKFYIRRITVSKSDPIYNFLKEEGVPVIEQEGNSNVLFEFPVKTPKNCCTKDDKNAIEQLEHWKMVKQKFTEGNPSATIYVSDNEWIEVIQWLYKNWEIIVGLSFFPKDNNIYPNAPFEAISEERYNEMNKVFPKEIDFSKMKEQDDNTSGQREFACAGGKCEL